MGLTEQLQKAQRAIRTARREVEKVELPKGAHRAQVGRRVAALDALDDAAGDVQRLVEKYQGS